MNTICPLCGKSVDRTQIYVHLADHDLADEIERKIVLTRKPVKK